MRQKAFITNLVIRISGNADSTTIFSAMTRTTPCILNTSAKTYLNGNWMNYILNFSAKKPQKICGFSISYLLSPCFTNSIITNANAINTAEYGNKDT